MWQKASSEKRIFIDSGSGITLEALLAENKGEYAVVVAHPHPLYGGNMYNNVVEAVISAYYEMGYTTVRFNFRGVGDSSGSFDNGIGEMEDVKAIFNYLLEVGKKEIAVSGYSFGAYVVAACLNALTQADHVVLVSPPVSMIDFSFLKNESRIKLVITGSYDYIAPPDMLKSIVAEWNPEAMLKVINGADHFYWNHTPYIENTIKEFLESYHV